MVSTACWQARMVPHACCILHAAVLQISKFIGEHHLASLPHVLSLSIVTRAWSAFSRS